MSIANKLNQIKNAIYGKEVRGAIHDAIKQVYDDASVNHDNANMEVKLARGTHTTLNDRLDKSDEIQAQTNAQLSQKLDKNGIVTMSNMGQDVKEAMTGGSVAVVGKDTVLSENIVNRQVTREKTNFYDYLLSGNLVNSLTVEIGKGYYSDGTPSVNTEHKMITIYKDQLDFVNKVKIKYSVPCDFAFWGKENEFISGYHYQHVNRDLPGTMANIPVTADRVTITFNDLENAIICIAENYNKNLTGHYVDKELRIENTQILGDIDITKIKDFQMYPNGNLITRLNTTYGYYYLSDGALKTADAYMVTIDIEPNQIYSFNFDTIYTFWDADGVFIKGGHWGSLSGTTNVADFNSTNIPTNASVLKMMIYTTDFGSHAVLSKKDCFKVGLKPSYVIDGLISTQENVEGTQIANPLHGKKAVFLGDSWCAGNSESRGTWASRIKTNNPTMTVTNYGLHGADWAQCSIHVLDNTERMNTIKEADYIIIEAYTNGLYGETSQLGKSLGEIDEFNYLTLEQIDSLPNSYAKDLEKALYRIATECHGKKIGVIFPYKAVAHLSPSNAFVTFRPQVMACCRKYNIPVFDNFDGCNIPSWHEELRKDYYVENDTVHLNAKGYDVITPSIENWMKSL